MMITLMYPALNVANRLYNAALTLVYPQACAVCGGSVESRLDGVVCDGCWEATPIFAEHQALCWKCGALSGASVAESRREAIRCSRCDDDSFTAARAGGNYEGGLRASILELKRQPNLPARLLILMIALLEREPLRNADLIVPVALHPARERERGFNQAQLLAAEIARRSGLPLEPNVLVRPAQTRMHRAGMDGKARRKSVAGAFAVRHPELVKGKRVLLVDDVFTTGATASACASVLKSAGADAVFVLTIARA